MNAQEKDAARLVGDRLRDIRHSLGLSLMGLDEKSAGRWKAVVVGSYERADRAITVGRLVELCDWYRVDPSSLLYGLRAEVPSDPRVRMVAALQHARAAAAGLAGLLGEGGAADGGDGS